MLDDVSLGMGPSRGGEWLGLVVAAVTEPVAVLGIFSSSSFSFLEDDR